jgi:deoxyribodipyrimidine photo-lyase
VSTAVVVFTRDLRTRDHPALIAAGESQHVVPLFVIDEALVRGPHACANRLRFLIESLADLDVSLRERGAALVVRRGRWIDEVDDVVRGCNADVVHCSGDVSGFANARLDQLRAVGARQGCAVIAHPGTTVVPPGELLTGSGTTYKMFTPFSRRWNAAVWRSPVPPPERLSLPAGVDLGSVPELATLTGATPSPDLPPGGERAGLARMRTWTADALAGYAEAQDDLAADMTSRVSPYLHFGCLSPLEVATRLRSRAGGGAFVRQLCWRDFFHQLLAARPELARQDLRSRGTPSGTEDAAFSAWCAGQTGYPLVDAGMRQLQREGFMHNRARMVVASFLTKDLDVPWQLGARHFMKFLVDGDVANNQLNWQWAAGTGTDANPHRVFNPTRQSERFDPDGTYIRRYVSELADLAAPLIHDPPDPERVHRGYPAKLVDHSQAIASYRARIGATR